MARLAKHWPPVVSALLALLAFPPFDLGLLVFAAFVPWLMSLREASTGRAAMWSGYWFGLVYMLGQMHFLGFLTGRWTGSLVLAIVPWILAGVVGAWYFALAGYLIRACWKLNLPWLIPLAWAGVEVFRSYIPGLAFPYGLLAGPLWRTPILIQTAFYGSIYVVSAWVVLINLIVASMVAGDRFRTVRNYFLVAIVVAFASIVQYTSPIQGEPHGVTIGQPGLDFAFGDDQANQAKLAPTVERFYTIARNAGSELLLLPEGLVAGGDIPPATPFAIEPSPPIVFGGKRGHSPAYQSAFAYDGKWQFADKTRLVIFGEYVPGRNLFPFLATAFQLPGGDLEPGEKVRSLRVGKLNVGPVICFEGLFPDIAYRQALNGAQILTVMSVDDWYFGTGAPAQLRSASVWRAVETGLPLIRSATQGYSLAVNQRGDIVTELPLGEAKAAPVLLRIESDPHPFRAWALFPVLALLSIVAIPAIARFRKE